MKRIMFLTLILAVTFLFVEFFPKSAEAIPVFSRKYKTACITCHATFPRLTALGEAIRLNGFKMPDGDELYVKDMPVIMGVAAYKKVFPEAVWPSDIPGMPPISLRVIGDLEYDVGDDASSRDNRYKIEFPHELEILFGGSFGENMSFFGEIEFEHHKDAPSGQELELDYEAWLMWEDILGENFFNIKAGNIGMHEIDPPNTRDHQKITKSHYLVNEKITAGLAGPGIEVNGFGKVWRYAAGIVKPQNEFGDAGFYLQASLKFGGLGYDGSGGTFEEGLTTTPSGYWRDDSVLVGAFYFDGDDNINRYGIDARWNFKDLSLATGYVKADDDTSTNNDKDVWFAEAEYFVFPWLQSYIRYETFSADAANTDEARVIVGSVLLARANVKVNLEGRFYTENEPDEAAGKNKNVDNRLFLRLDYAL